MTARNIIARDIHARMVDDERFGYDWDERWGNRSERWTVDGISFDIKVGDYDCSSSSITAWKKALTGTDYADALDGATYTGNIRSVFTRSGLFDWKPMSFTAQPGDLYLAEGHHVAMCQTVTPDILSEFSSNEHGGVYGGKRGDQTGWESHKRSFYNYPWDGILHYNGKADKEDDVSARDVWEYPVGRDATPGKQNMPAWMTLSWTNHDTAKMYELFAKGYNGPKNTPQSGWNLADRICMLDKYCTDLSKQVPEIEKKVEALDKKLDEIIRALG